jgi:hypothetical protein
MKPVFALRIAAILAVTALAASPALAQRGRGGGGMGMGMPRYDKATERTVTGTVEHLQPQQGRGQGMGLHLAVKTDTGVLDVHVGPTAWLTEQKFEFAEGDVLTIVGSPVKMGDSDAFLAREITKAGKTMTLRNGDGFPLWAGRGGRASQP